jgi:hypothetical protein
VNAVVSLAARTVTTIRARLYVLIALSLLAGLLASCGDSSGGAKDSSRPAADAGFSLAASSAIVSGKVQPYPTKGRLLADSGFRPNTNGFQFENYGPGNQDLTAAQVADLFGPQVCASGSGTSCVLTPPAQIWLSAENKAMQSGHCFGFSLTSLMIFKGQLDPLQYGAPVAFQLPLVGNVALQERLAESFSLQDSPQVQRAELGGTPNAELMYLKKVLAARQETYTIGMFDHAGGVGHAVTPYAVQQNGKGQYAVLIYDNNYPGITRGISFDTKRDTWSYESAANPRAPSDLFHGEGKKNELALIPTGPALGVQPCPFCSVTGQTHPSPPTDDNAPANLNQSGTLKAGQYEEVSLLGDSLNHGHLVITDAAGRKTGFVDGRFVDQIPGAQVIAPLVNQDFNEAPEPRYQIPRSAQFTVTLDGGELRAPDLESVSVIGPGYSGAASDINLQPDQQAQLSLSNDGNSLSYRAGAGEEQSPQLQIGLQRPGGDYQFSVSTPPISGGSTVTAIAQPAEGKLTLDAKAVKNSGKYGLAVKQLRPSGAHPVNGRSVHVQRGGSAKLALHHRGSK